MQTEYENVKLTAKANIYQDGKVISHTFHMPNGDRKTIGTIFPGEYEFGTGDAELMEPVAGTFTALLPGSSEWQDFAPGTSFSIPANSKFKVRCSELSEYVCSYIKG